MSNDNQDPKQFKPAAPPEPASLDSIIVSTTRGDGVDKDAADALAKLDGPPLPGAAEANARQELRSMKIAAIRANRGRVLNSFAEGGLEGLAALAAVTLIGVTLGPEIAIGAGVVGVVVALVKGL